MLKLFPSAAGLEVTWHSIVKIGQSLYREAPGMDVFRPDQVTPVDRFFLAGSYTKQDYIDSMCVLNLTCLAYFGNIQMTYMHAGRARRCLADCVLAKS